MRRLNVAPQKVGTNAFTALGAFDLLDHLGWIESMCDSGVAPQKVDGNALTALSAFELLLLG